MDRCFVLLLDEDEDDYQLVKSFIREAFQGAVTLDWFQRDGLSSTLICSGYYLVILVEYQISGENGLEVICKAKANCPEQKIFLLTGWDENTVSHEKALEAGADRVLRKNNLSMKMIKEAISPYMIKERCPGAK